MTNQTKANAERRVESAQKEWSFDPTPEYLAWLEVTLQDWLDEVRAMRRRLTP